MTVTTREVGKAWATRSLGIALAICMSLTVGGDLTVRSGAVPWSGILDPSRAIDWSHAGIPGGIPNRATLCASVAPGSRGAQSDAAITACPADQVVLLSAGTFSLSAGLNMKSDVTLRGGGANRTKLVFTGTTQCDRGPPPYPVICLKGSFSWSGGVENSADWTAGYAKGTTVITLSNTANLRAGESFLILDQVDDTADGGDIYNCGIANGCVSQGSDGMRTAPGGYRNKRQVVKVAAVAGNQNNIFHHVTSPRLVGTGSGDVLTYNFAIDDLYTPGGGGWMQPNYAGHNGGDAMLLIEGNDGLGAGTDNIHGTHHFLTFFRNHFHGDPNKTANTATMHLWAYSRFFNIIGNVLGRPTYYTTYQTDLGTDDVDIYSFGQPDLGLSGDPRTRETAMRWGNFDTVSATSRFDPAEVPSGLTNFANPVPASQVLS